MYFKLVRLNKFVSTFKTKFKIGKAGYTVLQLLFSCFKKQQKDLSSQAQAKLNLKKISIVKVITLGLLLRAYSMAWRSVGANNADLIRQLRGETPLSVPI